MSQNSYVIDGGQAGKDRLSLLGRVLQPTTARLFDQVGVREGMRVLDLGCGGGNVTLDLARRVGGSGQAIGLDVDATILALARDDAAAAGLRNVAFRVCDARHLDAPPIYDLVYARCLLSHLAAPQQTLARMMDAARPGGVIVVEDIDLSGSFCYPACAAYQRQLDLYTSVVQHNGGDPCIGQKLAGMLLDAGLTEVGVQVFQPVYREGAGKRMVQVTLERTASAITAAGFAGAAEIAATIAELAAFTARSDTILSLPRFFQVWGVRGA